MRTSRLRLWSLVGISVVALVGACSAPQPDRSAPFSLGGNSLVMGFTPTPSPFVPKGEEGGHAAPDGGGHAAPTPAPAQSPAAGGGGEQDAAGQKIFLSVGCVGCHTIQGLQGDNGKVGPELTHVASTAGSRVPGMDAQAYLLRKVTDPGFNTVEGFPGGVMPTLVKPGPDADALVAFLLTRQ
jgi:mono/diheme cytochrome c family protein